jgi:hypothetical protein
MIGKAINDLAGHAGLPETGLDELVERVALVLKDWFIHLFVRNAADVFLLRKNATKYARLLHQELRQLDLAPQVLRMAVVGSDFDLLLKLLIARQWQRDLSADLPCFFGPVLA